MNKIDGILEQIDGANSGILRLFVRFCGYTFSILLLEKSPNFAPNANLKLGFKESSVFLAKEIKGAKNCAKARILEIKKDNLFSRISLEICPLLDSMQSSIFIESSSKSHEDSIDFIESESIKITALVDINTANTLKCDDLVDFYISESDIMLL